MQNSPATEVPLPGDLVWIRHRRWRVERAMRDRNLIRIDASRSGLLRTFLAPPDKVWPAGETRGRTVRRQQGRALLAAAIGRSPDPRLPLALLDARVDILPHQIEPALAVAAGHPRLLIADEVGLGKTIQAGVIVAELLRREPVVRALIVAPAPLREQWAGELGGRFGIPCLRGDRASVDALSREGAFGANPWSRAGVWLASLDFLKQHHVIASLPADPWDLLVVDEAHTVCGDSERHSACQRIARHARRVVLLTATPHSGDAVRFGRLTTLGASSTAEMPIVFRRTRQDVGMDARRRVHWHSVSLTSLESRVLDELSAFEAAVLKASSVGTWNGALLLLSMFRKRALSTFSALHLSIERRLAWLNRDSGDSTVWTQPRLIFEGDREDTDGDERLGLTAETGMDPRRESLWLRRLGRLCGEARLVDSKIVRVIRLLERSVEPAVIFTEFRDSLEALEGRLRRARQFAVLHGAQDPAEQSRQLSRYISGAASVLLATDVAGQGLNLQSRGRWVVSLELPWNPVRLEQRLGRVDRIGQIRTPHLTLLIARHAAERGLLSHLARRVLNAQKVCGSGLLHSVLPPERDVRTAMFTSREPAEGALALQPSRRWRRCGTVVARALRRRRLLVTAWRGAQETPNVIRIRAGGQRQLVCSIPILNGAGEPVYRHRVLVRLLSPPINCDADELLEDIWPVVECQTMRTLRKLEAAAGRSLSRRLLREFELSAGLAGDDHVREAQPGLFDSRQLQRFLVDRDERERVLSANREGVEHLERVSRLSLGRLDVEFVLGDGVV